jgi:hypothetical protein
VVETTIYRQVTEVFARRFQIPLYISYKTTFFKLSWSQFMSDFDNCYINKSRKVAVVDRFFLQIIHYFTLGHKLCFHFTLGHQLYLHFGVPGEKPPTCCKSLTNFIT